MFASHKIQQNYRFAKTSSLFMSKIKNKILKLMYCRQIVVKGGLGNFDNAI